MKCNVPKCENEEWQGAFYGNLCKPCHEWIKREVEFLKDSKDYSQAYRNVLDESIEYLKSAELCEVVQKWNEYKK
jgi:hypothetical protein